MKFIDVHGHYAWGIDDGMPNQVDAIKALELAAKNNICAIIATPHVIPGQHTSSDILEIKKRIQELRTLAKQFKILVFDGCELFLNHDYLSAITKNIFIPMENSQYLLVEFDVRKPLGEQYEVEDYLYEIEMMKIKPIIAHIERYFSQDIDIDRIKGLIDSGYVIQINATSLLGVHGKKIQKNAYRLLNEGLVHLIGSDTHRCSGKRSPCLMEAYTQLANKYDEQTLQTLFFDNPLHILNNEPVETIHVKKTFFKKLLKRG